MGQLRTVSLTITAVRGILYRGGIGPIIGFQHGTSFVHCRHPIPNSQIRVSAYGVNPNLCRCASISSYAHSEILELCSHHATTGALSFVSYIVRRVPFPVRHLRASQKERFFTIGIRRGLGRCDVGFHPGGPTSPRLGNGIRHSRGASGTRFCTAMSLSASSLGRLLTR